MAWNDCTEKQKKKILKDRFLPYQTEHRVQGHDTFTKEALTHNPADFVKSVCLVVGCEKEI